MSESQPGVKSGSQAKGRSRLRGKVASTPKTASPTRPIEPGAVHYAIAEKLLRAAQKRVEDATGQPLNIGEVPEGGIANSEDENPTEVIDRTAHAVARAGDRFTFFRRFSRHFEGADKRAGLLADIGAAIVALYRRNPRVFDSLARQFAGELQERRAAKETAASNNSQPTPGGIAND